MKQYGVIPKFSKCLDKALMQAEAHPFPRHFSLVLSNPKAPCLKKCQEKILFIYCGMGKKHAFKKYDQFALNTSCFWGSTRSNTYYPSCAISRNLC